MSESLRDYQVQALEKIWESISDSHEALCVLPTGSGKTVIMSALIDKSVELGVNVLVLIGRVQLIDQTVKRLSTAKAYCASLGEKDDKAQVIVASIQSIYKIDLKKIHLLILDEVHNAASDDEESSYYKFIKKLKDKNDKLKVVGFTATPFRATSGVIYGEGKLFSKICYQLPLEYMIEQGYLVRPISKRPENQLDISSLRVRAGEYNQEDVDALVMSDQTISLHVSDAMRKTSDRHKVLWACASIKHAEAIKKEIEKHEPCSIVHSKLSIEEFNKEKASFETGSTRHIAFVSMMTEGYDYPPADALVLLRPIRSPVLYVQIVGRVLRPSEGKINALVLDYGRVVETLGPVSNPRVPKKRGKPQSYLETDMTFCPNCLSYLSIDYQTCPDCGYEREIKERKTKASTSAFEGSLLVKEPKTKTLEIRQVILSKFVSKNGNECLKVTYIPASFLSSPINEFFAMSSEYVIRRRLIPRLNDLDIPLRSLDEMIRLKVRTPSKIEYVMTKYPEVKKLFFDDREADRDGNSGLA